MKNSIYLFLCIIIILYYILAPNEAFLASKEGLLLWFEQLLPTLLPFSIISNLLVCSNLFSEIHRKKGFPFSIAKGFIVFCGFLFGFPIGSKLTADFYHKGLLNQKEAQILCFFTNNLSPVFLSSYVCNAMLHHTNWILPMYVNLYLPSLLYGIILLYRTKRLCHLKGVQDIHKNMPESKFCINMQLLDTGIINSFLVLIKLCGYIVMFSILVHFITGITWLPPVIKLVLTCSLEVTNATASIAAYPLPDNVLYICCIAMLSLGGACTMAQTGSILSQTDLSLKKYVLQRLVLTVICTICAAIYQLFLIFIL